ncbi:MAG TPA: hypothetical protein VGP68_12765 [Gemmataceae bacterium]|nr:hypothetical protein [Gemmataceae bacterium]
MSTVDSTTAAEDREESQAVMDKLLNGKPIPLEIARRIRERGDRIREEILLRHGLVDIAVPSIREIRDK